MTTFKLSLFPAWLYRKYDFVKSQTKHSTQKTNRLGISKILSTILSPSKLTEELSFCPKLWIYNPYFFGTQCRTSLIFQTYIIWSNRIDSLKYLRFTTLESKDIRLRKSEFVAKTQFLCPDSSLLKLNITVQMCNSFVNFSFEKLIMI